MQSIGQMSTQASHSMQSAPLNTVWTSQLRQRCALQIGKLAVETQLDLHLHVLEGDGLVAQWHAVAPVIGDVVVVAPLVDAHLLADEADTSGGGRWRMSSPRQNLSMEIAASCPCATAQMMFLGPKAESPPKNTLGRVDCMVSGSTFGMPRWSNSRPISRSIQGKAFSWPIAIAHRRRAMLSGSPVATRLRRPSSSSSRRHLLEEHAG